MEALGFEFDLDNDFAEAFQVVPVAVHIAAADDADAAVAEGFAAVPAALVRRRRGAVRFLSGGSAWAAEAPARSAPGEGGRHSIPGIPRNYLGFP